MLHTGIKFLEIEVFYLSKFYKKNRSKAIPVRGLGGL
jgi:hypothetical protein